MRNKPIVYLAGCLDPQADSNMIFVAMEQDGEAIPAADLDHIKAGKNEMVVPVTVWMTPFRDEMENRAVKKTLTIPAWLNDAAEKRRVNYSQVLQSALKDYLGVYHP